MYIGIEQHSGLIYEGYGGPELLIIPTPNVTQVTLIDAPEIWQKLPLGLTNDPLTWIFREDSFDAVTRTRRGRLYSPLSGVSQPHPSRVVPHPYDDPMGRSVGHGGRTAKNLYTYSACNELLMKRNQGLGITLALGTSRAASAWRIVQTEITASGCVVVTLKALTAFGIVPEIDLSKIEPEFKTHVNQAVSRVLDSAFRETPISVIDHCRNAITVLLSSWLVQKGSDRSILGKELAHVASIVESEPYKKICSSNLAKVVARLHARGKGNEQYVRNLRIPIEEDADVAIHALGFILRDLEWAVAP